MMFNLKDAFFVPSAEYPTQLEWEDFFLIRLYQIAHYTKSPRTGISTILEFFGLFKTNRLDLCIYLYCAVEKKNFERFQQIE